MGIPRVFKDRTGCCLCFHEIESFLGSERVGNLFKAIDRVKDGDRRSSKDDQAEVASVRMGR
jgi:hypothetical protein